MEKGASPTFITPFLVVIPAELLNLRNAPYDCTVCKIDGPVIQVMTLMMPANKHNPRLEEAVQFLKGPDFVPTDSQRVMPFDCERTKVKAAELVLTQGQFHDVVTMTFANCLEAFPRCPWNVRRNIRQGLRRCRNNAIRPTQSAFDRIDADWCEFWK